MAASKKRVIKSLDSLNEELKELLRNQYPNGYEGSITRIVTPKKEPIFVFPLETTDATYLIKIPVTKNSDGEYDVEQAEKGEFSEPPGPVAAAPANDDDFGRNDDDFDNRNEEEEEERDSDYDEEGGGSKRSREASYDPDFDG
jgi:hypothetical protein